MAQENGRQIRQRETRGFTLIELADRRGHHRHPGIHRHPELAGEPASLAYSRAASDTKTAMSQAIIYAGDKGVYPPSLDALQAAGYATVGKTDPWSEDYVLSPLLNGASVPAISDELYIFSKGASKAGTYPVPFVSNTGIGGLSATPPCTGPG